MEFALGGKRCFNSKQRSEAGGNGVGECDLGDFRLREYARGKPIRSTPGTQPRHQLEGEFREQTIKGSPKGTGKGGPDGGAMTHLHAGRRPMEGGEGVKDPTTR